MKNKIVESLLKIANDLDEAGLHDNAAELDAVTQSIIDKDKTFNPAPSYSDLEQSILSEHASKPAILGDDYPQKKSVDTLAVKKLEQSLKKKFKNVIIGEGLTAKEAMKDAETKIKKAFPGKVPAKMDSMVVDGKSFILLSF